MGQALAGVQYIERKPPMTAADEQRLLLDCIARQQDREAFRALFDHFAPRIKALMIASGASPALADDLVQDAMLAVWRKAQSYAPHKATVSTWIFAIARNARIDRLRRASSQPYDDIDSLEIEADIANGEDHAIAQNQATRVSEAIAELPEEQRVIIEMAFMQDLTQSDIAQRMEIPLGTVKSRMRLAYSKLREKLEHLQ